MVQRGQAQGGRPRHIPQRTCIVCRQNDAKRALVRLVRDATGRVSVDTTGKRAGRGAYVCHDPACWATAVKRHVLERALRIETLHPDDRSALVEFARRLAPPPQENEREDNATTR